MRKKLLITLALILQLAAAAVLLHRFLPSSPGEYISIDGNRYRRDSTYLDLSGGPVSQPERLAELTGLRRLNLRGTGLTAAQYDGLRAALPDCEISWSPYFQGKYYPDTTTSLTITHLTGEDVRMLAYFPRLSTVNAAGCRDYDQLMALQTLLPDCAVFYDVTLGSETWSQDATRLVLPDADPERVMEQLRFLPRVEQVLFTGKLPDIAELSALMEAYPQIEMRWQVDIFGVTADMTATELDLSGIPVEKVAQVEQVLPYLPKLQKVIMCDCGIPNEEMDALNRRHPEIQFVWSVSIGPYLRIRTDTTALIPVKYNVWVDDEDCYNLRYCTEMVCLDLGHQDITRCDFVAYMPKLKYLILADTHISDLTPLENCKELIFLELFLTWVRDYSPLLGCTALEDLNLGYTYGDSRVIAQMTWLDRLWWSGGGGSRAILAPALPDTQIYLTAGSSTGEGWRKGKNYYDMRDMLGMGYMTH